MASGDLRGVLQVRIAIIPPLPIPLWKLAWLARPSSKAAAGSLCMSTSTSLPPARIIRTYLPTVRYSTITNLFLPCTASSRNKPTTADATQSSPSSNSDDASPVPVVRVQYYLASERASGKASSYLHTVRRPTCALGSRRIYKRCSLLRYVLLLFSKAAVAHHTCCHPTRRSLQDP